MDKAPLFLPFIYTDDIIRIARHPGTFRVDYGARPLDSCVEVVIDDVVIVISDLFYLADRL